MITTRWLNVVRILSTMSEPNINVLCIILAISEPNIIITTRVNKLNVVYIISTMSEPNMITTRWCFHHFNHVWTQHDPDDWMMFALFESCLNLTLSLPDDWMLWCLNLPSSPPDDWMLYASFQPCLNLTWSLSRCSFLSLHTKRSYYMSIIDAVLCV